MSLFADKWPSPFDSTNPFGLDNFHSSSLGAFRWGSGSSFFGDDSEEEILPSKMKLRNSPSLAAERGFYDHFNSIFHDMRTTSSSRRKYDLRGENSSRQSALQPSDQKGKERVIPIKIETSSARDGNNSYLSSTSSKIEKEGSRCSSSSSPSSGQNDTGRVVQIPVVREGSCQKNSRGKSRSPVIADTFQVPPRSTLLTPTTEKNGSTQKRDSTKDVHLDSDFFFEKSRNTPRQSHLVRTDSDILEIEEEEVEEITIRSLRRKPLRHLRTDAAVSSRVASHDTTPAEAEAADSSRRLTSFRNDGHKNDVGCEEARVKEREEKERERRQPLCSNSGSTDVTSPPSYSIYDYLRPRLAKIGRQVDYIRGDGNCFFRALSKEMYGSEDYHAEWREAVCDVISSHPHVFSQYVDGSSVDSHVKEMRTLGTWATTCEIYATATLLQREVYVLAPCPTGDLNSAAYNWLLFSPRSLSGSSAGGSRSKLAAAAHDADCSHDDVHPCYLTLCHTNGNHYDRITPVLARCNCEIPPPSLNGVSVLVDLTASDEEELELMEG